MGQEFFKIMADIAISLADNILPRYCIVCGRRLATFERHLCLYCWGDFPYTRNWMFKHNNMADRFNSILVRKSPEKESHGFYQYAAALFFYQEHNNYRKITQSIKYKADISAGKYFGSMLGKRLAGSWGKDVDLVVPIPLHWTRKLSRGYNQAAVVAGGIAGVLGAWMAPDGLVRTRRTKTQTKIATEDKEKNVEGAFQANPRRLEMLRGCKHIIIVDDVFTTGSTMSSAYFALRRAVGDKVRISAVTLGCVQQ